MQVFLDWSGVGCFDYQSPLRSPEKELSLFVVIINVGPIIAYMSQYGTIIIVLEKLTD